MEGTTSQGMQSLETGKGQEMDPLLEPPEGAEPCQNLDFSPMTDFQPSE